MIILFIIVCAGVFYYSCTNEEREEIKSRINELTKED